MKGTQGAARAPGSVYAVWRRGAPTGGDQEPDRETGEAGYADRGYRGELATERREQLRIIDTRPSRRKYTRGNTERAPTAARAQEPRARLDRRENG